MVTAKPSGQRQGGRGARHPAAEEVGGDEPPPHRLLQNGPVVVRPYLGARHHRLLSGLHRRPPSTAMATAPASPRAALPAAFHIAGRSRVVTTGSGGRRYTSGSSSSRKKAPMPPTPSPGSSP